MTSYDRLPEHMREGARRYIEQGIDPGRFMKSVLENRFVEAIGCADHYNSLSLKDWALWLMWDIPSDAWGSPEKVKAYMQRMQIMRSRERIEAGRG